MPSPQHQRGLHVLHDFIDAAMAVGCGILEQFTQLPIVQPFPDHGLTRCRQMPTGSSGRHVLSLKIVVLMASAAFQSSNALAIKATPDVHRMPVSVVALPGKVSAGMAIHATRMPQHGNDR